MYDREGIERLLPCLWDEQLRVTGVRNPREPDHDMPKGPPPNPAHSGTHWASVADIDRAWRWARLTTRQRQVLLLCHGFGETQRDAGAILGIGKGAITEHHDAAIGNIGHYLNGRGFGSNNEGEEAV